MGGGGNRGGGRAFKVDFVCHALAYHCEKGKGGGEGIEARALEQEEIQQRLRERRERAKMGQMDRTKRKGEGIQKRQKKKAARHYAKIRKQ